VSIISEKKTPWVDFTKFFFAERKIAGSQRSSKKSHFNFTSNKNSKFQAKIGLNTFCQIFLPFAQHCAPKNVSHP